MFTLPNDLTIAQVEACREQYLAYIEAHDDIELDDSDVNRIDTVGVQLLLAMVLHSVALKKSLTWQNKSSVVNSSVKQLGIHDPSLLHNLD
ncbi:STAS domain-containing protein [Thalassotalea hakodatensis]|uniref:STAS domain-containing protein n=1 Tax=Thalassotalea hakodatensis TaxID=3030492 RepID=UPI0025740697|nr:STAS domain-containing protein [Thalassotalea hakodatensis]